MRNIFAEELYKHAIKNKKIYILVSDISPAGNMLNFQKKYPDRFVGLCAVPLQHPKIAAKILENCKNESILKLSSQKIQKKKEEVLNELYLPKKCLKNM